MTGAGGALRRLLRRQPAEPEFAVPRLLRAFADHQPDAFFIEVGANDGDQHDHLRPFIVDGAFRGIMVEPVPYVFERLRRNYAGIDRVALENVAVADRDGVLPFFHLVEVPDPPAEGLPPWYDGTGSFSRDALLRHATEIPDVEGRIVRSDVPCLTLGSLCARHGVQRIDLLVVDTEGHDWEILRHAPLRSLRPRLVLYEHFHLSPDDRAACRAHMEGEGYATMEEGFDTLCLDLAPGDELSELWRSLRPGVAGVAAYEEEDRRYLTTLYDDSVPLPPGAEEELTQDNPRLRELRAEYAALDLPVLAPSRRWSQEARDVFLDLRWFRGESLITWHYRELPRITALKYFLLGQYVAGRDPRGLLESLEEDGAFGCWTFDYPGHGRYSRDVLESVNEICFLDRQLGLSDRPSFSVLDIGAGYGRLAHRMSAAFPGRLADYCCVDAVPESTFLSEYYLRHRGAAPPARVVSLGAIDELQAGSFDLAVNIHSFSECPLAAIEWWAQLLRRLEVPALLVVPNEPDGLLSLELGGERHDAVPALEAAGYRLRHSEPVIDDPAVRELVGVHDRFHLFLLEA